MSLSSTMEDWADRVKNSIEAIVESVKDANQALEIRVGLVGYRDVQSPNRIEKVYFTQDINSFKDFMFRTLVQS